MAARDACGECRRWQLDRDCCRVGLLRRSTLQLPLADDADHISALPDDLLLQILADLRCARAAANTSLLSRRWRGLWTRCPQLIFHAIAPDQLHAALGQIARPAGSLDISIPSHHSLSPDRIASLFGAVALLATTELSVRIYAEWSACSDADVVDLPCSDRIASLSLHCFGPPLTLRLRPGGDFTALESLTCCCDMDLGDLLPRCPCLCKLDLSGWQNDSITVHSPSLQELDVSTHTDLQRVDIVAAVLKKLTLRAKEGISDDFSLSLSAPLVDDLSWYCRSRSTSRRFGVTWCMWSLRLETLEHFVHAQLTNSREDNCLQPQHRTNGNILLQHIEAVQYDSGDMALTFEQEIFRHPVRNISVL